MPGKGSAQVLDWQTGDVYRTESGVVMTLTRSAQSLEAFDEYRVNHLFGMDGRAECRCGHGDLITRITGTIHA